MEIGPLHNAYRSVRRDEVLLCRLRIGHTRLTHSFLFNEEDPPECDTCQCITTVKHILLNCTKYTAFRQELFKDYTTLHDVEQYCMYVMILFSVNIYNADICDSHSWPGKINNFYLSGNP